MPGLRDLWTAGRHARPLIARCADRHPSRGSRGVCHLQVASLRASSSARRAWCARASHVAAKPTGTSPSR